MSECRWMGSDRPRAVRGRHDDECPELMWHPPLVWVDCPGCAPCNKPHCLVQWYGDRGDCETHAETVCPSCLGKAREHLAEIVRLSGVPLLAELLALGNDDNEAADLLGPVADPAQWRQRGTYGHVYHPDARMGELHPYWVLGTWDLLVTEHLGHRRTQRANVTTSAAYLDANLTFLAADIEFDFAVMANELANCRTYLERILHEGEQRDEGVPCMTCGRPLTRAWGDGKREDGWECTRCREWSTEAQYRFAVKADYIAHAEWLTDSDMVARFPQHKISAATVRTWALDRPNRPAVVRKRRHSERIEFSVEDVAAHLAKRVDVA